MPADQQTSTTVNPVTGQLTTGGQDHDAQLNTAAAVLMQEIQSTGATPNDPGAYLAIAQRLDHGVPVAAAEKTTLWTRRWSCKSADRTFAVSQEDGEAP